MRSGRWACSTAISAFSLSARSWRPAPSKAVMLSLRCLMSLSTMATIAASSSVMRSSTSFCFIAACNRRMVPRRSLSLARMAVFMSSVIWSLRLMAASFFGFQTGTEGLHKAPLARRSAVDSSVATARRCNDARGALCRPEKTKPALGVPSAGWAACPRTMPKLCLVQLLGQLHAAHALVVALDGGSLLALALGGGLFVELAGAQVGQQAELFNGALEAAQGNVKGFVLFYTDGGH